MKSYSIPSSDIVRFNRMDATFHIAYQQVKPRADYLESALTEASAQALLAEIPANLLAPVDPLATGMAPRGNEKTRRQSAARYPFIALALIEAEFPDMLESAQRRVEQAVAEKDALLALMAQIPKGPAHD